MAISTSGSPWGPYEDLGSPLVYHNEDSLVLIDNILLMIHHNEDSLVNFHCCALPNIHLHIHTIARPTHIYHHMYNFFGVLAIYNVLGWPN